MTVYIDSANFSTATTVYLDSLLTTVAPDGYYSSNGYYRQQVDGKLVDILPCVVIDTVSITNVGQTTATFNGNLIDNGGDVNAIRGFVYGTSTNPTTANTVVTDLVSGAGTYSLNVTGLTPVVTYYVKAYAIVFGNTVYGDQLNFTTPCSNCVPGTEVTISTQTWTVCNLNVSTYRDGTLIQQVTDPTQWDNLTTGAWCYYNNDSANGPIYGKIYNWYAVAGIWDAASLLDPLLRKQLAPVGYHVPSKSEFDTLVANLGGGSVAGGKMKEPNLCNWSTPNILLTPYSGFAALPGGYRMDVGGTFQTLGTYGTWWSSSESSTNPTQNGLNIVLSYNNITVFDGEDTKQRGFSVRLIKD